MMFGHEDPDHTGHWVERKPRPLPTWAQVLIAGSISLVCFIVLGVFR